MRILGSSWQSGFLDETLRPGTCRIRVQRWLAIAPVRGMYFVRPKSLRLLYNYWCEVGIKNVAIKVASRLKESLRNDKYIAVGIGEIIDSLGDSGFAKGAVVAFVAPSHPRAMERVVLSSTLIRLHTPGRGSGEDLATLPAVERVSGYNIDSGSLLEARDVDAIIDAAQPMEQGLAVSFADDELIRERCDVVDLRGDKPTAAIVGLGNYAKTAILPNIEGILQVRCIHEIDPAQIGKAEKGTVRYDTSPLLRDDEKYDAVFVAGFHHHHVEVALQALRQGSVAVIEKPLATTHADLDALERHLVDHGGRVYACFHKRYSPFNDWARQDLEAPLGSPISYHCIAYEVPLPPKHWYRWPTSRSRIVSNGCHWIDHFMFLNAFSPVKRHALYEADDETVSVSAELENGAMFTMTLTDAGSSRIGVQDHIELRTKTATAILTDGNSYRAENSHRVVRNRHVNKLNVYGSMYRRIAFDIANKSKGDSLASIVASSRFALHLDDELAG